MQFLGQKVHTLTQQTIDSTLDNTRDILLKLAALLLIGSVVVWISLFIYVAFYYAYMPAVTHTRPVHLQFQPCEPDLGVCSFPSAHVQLTRKEHLLKFGQQYKIILNMEMPESPRNKVLGMFMVCIQMRDKEGSLVAHSCRTSMLHYKSELLHTIKTILFSPFFLLGPQEEKQDVTVELFSDYEEDSIRPATDVYIELQSRHAEIYSAKLLINAHFTGLRYLMFNWPVISAVVGISTNIFFLGVICALSWFHLTQTSEEEYFDGNENNMFRFTGDLSDEELEYEDAEFKEEFPLAEPSISGPQKEQETGPSNEETSLRD